MFGVWRSPVARLLWEQEVPGSNPGAPILQQRYRSPAPRRSLSELSLLCSPVSANRHPRSTLAANGRRLPLHKASMSISIRHAWLAPACLGLTLSRAQPVVAQVPDTLSVCVAGATAAARDTLGVEVGDYAMIGRCPPPSGLTRTVTRKASDLPIDRIADLLALEPGVGSLGRGDLSVWGAGAGTNAIGSYLDGISITPMHRAFTSPLLGGSWLGEPGTGAAVGTNGFERIGLTPGVGPAEFSSARGGVIEVESRRPHEAGLGGQSRQLHVKAGVSSDAMLGAGQGLGYNRLTLEALGSTGRLSAAVTGVMEGQETARLGMDQNGSPVYLRAGVDSPVTFTTPSGPRSVEVLRFVPSDGLRVPSSVTSNYSLLGRVEFRPGERHLLRVTGLASQRQDRLFDYDNLYNPRQLRAARSWSRLVIASWLGRLVDHEAVGLTAEAYLSLQTDRGTTGPLSTSAEQGSREPFGGFMVGALGFRFDQGNFPVNGDLVRNFRTNSGRHSPYDLDNTTQYLLIDEYRNNAYGLTGFSESGGPVGFLTLSQEDRVLLKGVVEARFGRRQRLRVGAESERGKLAWYSASLVSQLESDAYRGSPRRTAAFADYEIRGDQVTVGAGLRYDRFSSGASRLEFPRISTNPGFNPAEPSAGFVTDRSHHRVTPRVYAAFQATPAIRVSGAAGSTAQIPDLAAVYAGVNTDLSVTNAANQTFGTDLGLERATFAQLSGHFDLLPGFAIDGTVWSRSDADLVVAEIGDEFDPLRQVPAAIRRYRNSGSASGKGLDLRASHQFLRRGQAWVGYGFADAQVQLPTIGSIDIQVNTVRTDVRRHTLMAAGWYQVDPESRALRGIVSDMGVYGTVRVASGTPYTRCALGTGNRPLTSDGFCVLNSTVGSINGARTPWIKLVDLKVTKGFHLGAAYFVAFADARNLFNTRNVLRVFVQNDRTANPLLVNDIRSGDLNEFANEADQNGVRGGDGTIDLSFGGVAEPRAACGSWRATSGVAAPPNCLYLLGAEERFGNGDHRFTLAEQTRASDAHYLVAWGDQRFTGSGRQVRLGLEVTF